MSNVEGLEAVICLVIFPEANRRAHCWGGMPPPDVLSSFCCKGPCLLLVECSAWSVWWGRSARSIPPLCGWEQASAGVQEPGGFRVRVFPEYLPSFWQSASLFLSQVCTYVCLQLLLAGFSSVNCLRESPVQMQSFPKLLCLIQIHSSHRRMETSFFR